MNIKNLYSIGEVAKIKNLTIKSLRYYHKIGILTPAYIDKFTGYRYYSAEQFIHIDIIKISRNIGTSIKELKDLFKSADPIKLQTFLDFKLSQAKENIRKISESIKCMKDLNVTLQASKLAIENNNISIDFIDTRYIIKFPCNQVGDFTELIYYSNLEKLIEEKEIKTTFESGIFYNANMDLELTKTPEYTFKVIDKSYFNKYNDIFAILPKGNYLTLTYNKDNEQGQKDKLLAYALQNNIAINNIIEIDILYDVFNTKAYNCQIQIPISKQAY